jgi:hypothetical protein
MPEWTPDTLKEYRTWMESNKGIKDPVERQLATIADSLQAAWANNRCQVCPLAETAALAAATLRFYRESKR